MKKCLIFIPTFTVTEWMTNFETKVKSFVEMQDLLDKAESIQLGRKDPDVYPFLSFIQS